MIITQPDRLILARQISQLAPSLSGSLLDIGGGKVQRYRTLCTSATTYHSLDINASWTPDIVASAENIPLSDRSIDAILCTQVLEHVPHPTQAMREMFRILKPNGTALITVPQWNELHEEPHDYFRYTRFGLRGIAEEAGFCVERIEQRGGYHACRAQMRIRYWIDRLRPYDRTWAMLFLAPWSMVATRWALLQDRLDHSQAGAKHAIGWTILLRKPL